MPARWSSHRRAATPDELARLRRHTRTAGWFAWLLVLFALAWDGWLFAIWFSWGTKSPHWEQPMIQAIWLLALLVAALVRIARRRSISGPAQADLRDATVEAIEVADAEVVELRSSRAHRDPAVAFALEGGRTLLLVGPWLLAAATYGVAAASDAPLFPACAFTVHRWPRSGEVLHIEVRGAFVVPTGFEAIDALPHDLPPSQVVDGDLASLTKRTLA